MALLLRMAGIPARVVTGFSTGATDTKTGEYVVRDFDAHSWVEVYYPDCGWLTFDPTPAARPRAASPPTPRAPPAAPAPARRRPARRDPLSERGAGIPVAGRVGARGGDYGDRRASRSPLLGLGASSRPAPLAPRRAARAVRARARARRTRREPAPGTTLHALELRFASTRPRPPATCARCARAATATSRAIPPARSAAACGPSSDAGAASSAGLRAWWASTPLPAVSLGPTIGGWTMSMTSTSEGWRCWRTGTSTRRRSRWRRPATWSPTRPRSARPGRACFRSGAFEEARAEFEAVVERAPTNDYALFCLGRSLMQLGRTAEARKPLDARGEHEPEAPRLPDLSRPRAQGGLTAYDIVERCYSEHTAFRGRKATLGSGRRARFFVE